MADPKYTQDEFDAAIAKATAPLIAKRDELMDEVKDSRRDMKKVQAQIAEIEQERSVAAKSAVSEEKESQSAARRAAEAEQRAAASDRKAAEDTVELDDHDHDGQPHDHEGHSHADHEDHEDHEDEHDEPAVEAVVDTEGASDDDATETEEKDS